MPKQSCELRIQYETFDSPDELEQDERDLVAAARASKQTAYAPYSHFHVGSAIMMDDGEIITGSNQENVIYIGTHAERSALDVVGTKGYKDPNSGKKISKIAIIGSPEGQESKKATAPCGMCRQDILEMEQLFGKEIVILMAATEGRIIRVVGAKNMLPFSFDADDLQGKPPVVE